MKEGELDLKALREARGLSLKEVYRLTKVSPAVLRSIEEGRFADLPEAVYARKLIKIYADFLGVDACAILASYERYLRSTKEGTVWDTQREGQEERAEGVVGRTKRSAALTAREDHGDTTDVGRKNFPRSSLIWAAGVALAVVIYLDVAYFYDLAPFHGQGVMAPRHQTTQTTATAPPAPVTQMTTEAAAPPSPPPAVPSAPAGKPLRLIIAVQEKCWLRIQQDDEKPITTMGEPGEQWEFQAASRFHLHIGNAGGVELTFQDRPLGKPGRRGEVVHLTLR
ncbi:MAG: DUF4115 domain-containing protein [Syntrophales bacterium]|nr:DUF4115 domain-containing protein [Syntrophales bacterium]